MSVQRFKVRDPRHLLSSPRATSPAAPCNPPPAAAPASLATAVMANSVEGPASQPSKQPAGAEAEAVAAAAAAKEERRLSEPVPKKRRLLQATEAEQSPGGQDVPEDILAQVINAVGIDSNLAESEVEEFPPAQPAEEVAGFQYLKGPLPPGMSLSPRMRSPDPRVRLAYPPQYTPLEGHYAVREVRHPYPYALRPHELGVPPPPYRHFFPRPYLRGPLPPGQALTRLPVVRPPGPEHLPPQHGAPGMPRHLRPPPLHPSPTGSPTEVRRILTGPPHPGLPGPSPGNPTHVYPGGPLGRPELQAHLREMRMPLHALPGAPYPHLRARVPEGLTRLPYDPRDPGRELGPHQVVVASHYPPGGPLPPRPVYSPDRHPGADPTWRPQPTEDGALRPPRRIIELPSPCVELIPIGPRRSSTASPPAAEGRQGSDPDNPPANTLVTGLKRLAEGPEGRRQSAPVLSVHPVRPPLAQRSFSSDTPRGPPAPVALAAEARRSSDPTVANVSASVQVDERGHVSGEEDATEKSSEEDTRPSSTNSDCTIEKVVLFNPGRGVVLPRLGQPAAHSEGHKATPQEEQPPSGDAGEVETHTEQSTVSSEVREAPPQTVQPGCGGDGSRPPAVNLNARRPASEPPSGTPPPSQVTRPRPASLPAPGTAPRPCPEGDDNATAEDAVFMERLQLVLSDLLSVPEATQLQELSCSPARLLSTLVRRCGVQPSVNPDLRKRLREDFKTMVQLCMPPTLIQDFGWESCTSEQILTQLLRLSHNGEDVNRRSSFSSYVPPDEALEDDVFSPPTPHAPPHTPHLSHTHPQPPQQPQSSPQAPHSSPQAPHSSPQAPHSSPQAPHSSQAHTQPSWPSQPPPLTSQPSHPLQQTSQPSPTHPRSSKASHPPPLTSQPSSTHPQTSQPSQTHPKPSQGSHPSPQPSEPSHPSPQTSQPSQTHSEPSQPSQTKPQPTPSSSTHPQTSQPSQTHSQHSQLSQAQPQTSQPSHSLPSSSQPSQSHPTPSKPSQTHPQTSQSTLSSSHPSLTQTQTSQPSHPPPATSQSSTTHPPISKASHPTPQSSQASQHPPASSSHVSKPLQNPPQVVKPSQPSPQRSQHPQPTQPSPSSSQPPVQVSKASPQMSKPSHPIPPSSILSSIRQPAPRPSLLPLTPVEHPYIPSSPTYHPASPSHLYQHLPPSSHTSHPPPLNPQPVLHTSHPPLRLPAAPTSSSSHLTSPTSQASHVIASTRPHLPPVTSTASHLPPQGSESHLHKPSHSPSSTSHPPHHLPASPSQPQHPMSRASHLPPSPSHSTRSSPLISPISPPPPTYITLVSTSRASHLPSHASSPSSSSSPTQPPSPSHSYIPVSSPSHVQSPRAPQYLPHVSQGVHLPQLVSHSTHIQPHASIPPRYPENMDEFEYTTQLQYYLQTAPRPGFPPQHYAIHRPPMRLPVPHPRVGGRTEVPAPPAPGKDGVIRHNHQHHQQQPHPPHPPPPHPPPRLVLRHSPPPPPPSHVRLASEKWMGNDEVVRSAPYPSTNGQVSPTSKSLPT